MHEIVGLEDVKRLVDEEGAQLLDVMSRESYEDSHLPAAINISLKELDAETATRLARSRPVIAYCFDYQ
jgi:rhodanese-related sulfurtransferase